MDLVLGVIDVPYEGEGGTTTGEVANYLERYEDGRIKYGVMTNFYGLKQDQIGKLLSQSVADAITSITAGAPPTIDPFADAMDDIKGLFTNYIEKEEITGASPAPQGVPTEAALQGESKRFKRRKGPRRPSFLDSGLYVASFRAWIEK